MAVTTPRLVGAVVAMAVLGAAGGYGVGDYTQRGLPVPSGSPQPLAGASVPLPSPTPKKKTPKPNNSKPLETESIEYRRQTFVAEGTTSSTITLEVPRGWRETRPEDDLARYNYVDGERWIRIRSGFPLTVPPAEAMRRLTAQLKNVPYDQALTMRSARGGNLTHDDGTKLTISTIAYTYIPDQTEKYVLVRSVGFGLPGYAAVEIGVIGLPQDKKALEAILDRATRTVQRKD